MRNVKPFKMTFVEQETHMKLPTVTSILLVQNLYDVLFQYLISEDEEKRLQELIARMEAHIKSKSKAPFSIPVKDLEFLQEGMTELKLLNWMEVPVSIYEISLLEESNDPEEDLENILEYLHDIIILSRKNNNHIYVFPYKITGV